MRNADQARNEKKEENQLVMPGSGLSLLALGLALAFITFPLLRGSQAQSTEKSIIKAQSVGYQAAAIEQNKFAQKDTKPARGPASIESEGGTLGQDPWGQPFHYKIRLEGDQKVVDVWSEGENAVRTQVLIPLNSNQNVQVPF